MKNLKNLFLLPIAVKPDIQLPDRIVKKEKTSWGSVRDLVTKNYIYASEIKDDVLIVTIFVPSGAPVYRVFQGLEDFATQKFENGQPVEKPSSATLHFLIWKDDYDFYTDTKNFVSTSAGTEAIERFLKKSPFYFSLSNDAIDSLEKYQQELRDRALKNRYDKIKASVDLIMMQINPLPKKVIEWVDKVPMKHSRYVFYDYQKSKSKKMTGYCTHCKNKVTVNGPKHNENGRCPHCRSDVIFKALGRFKQTNGFIDKGNFAYFQKTKSGYCIRYFEVSKEYEGDSYRTADVLIHEEIRMFYNAGHQFQRSYNWDNFRQTGDCRFCELGYEASHVSTFIYPGNLKKLIGDDPERKYLQIPEIAKNCGQLQVAALMSRAASHPYVEYLIKLKLYRLAADVINGKAHDIPENAKNLRDVLGVGREDISALRCLDISVAELPTYREIKKREGKVSVDEFLWLKRNLSGVREMIPILKYTTLKKAEGYLLSQLKDWPEKKKEHCYWYSDQTAYGEIIRDWKDYLGECSILKYDLKQDQVLYPKNLQDAHMRTSKLYQAKKDELCDRVIRARFNKLQREYQFSDEKFLIRGIRCFDELVAEGQALHHCVANYAERHAKGTTTIMVIRRVSEPDKPFFTLELNNGEVQQCRGSKNCSMTSEVKKFVDKWKKKKLQLQSTAKQRQGVA